MNAPQQNPKPTAPPRWFTTAIDRGLTSLLPGMLDGMPPMELFDNGAVLGYWVDALWRGVAWDEDLDAPRIAEAFHRVRATCRHWPAPPQLRELMPSRPEVPALPRPHNPMSERVRTMIADAAKSLGITSR